jgi:hypothetical protein
MRKRTETIADLVDELFQAFLAEYGDAELARLATSCTLTDLFAHAGWAETPADELLAAA